ncbi:MAG: DEAD/DEAH box helicase, partial [Edaphobacter sp.]
MDIFRYREELIGDYSAYVKGFLGIQDANIEEFVTSRLDGGSLWPEPLVQLNPAFVEGPTIDELVDQKRLHPTCREIFRRGKSLERPEGNMLRLHWHQAQALSCAQKDVNYVLTTGTGSGKSLAYLVPIIDHVLKTGSGHGIQAIVVYPMNALANSQLGEMEKFLGPGFPAGEPPVRFARYTGQENEEARDKILSNPPDVLLTNYVMLELILTRPRERQHLIQAAGGLKFLVLDELHTYRGRQGADVSMLVRRLRETLKAEGVLCVGTSATMGTGATLEAIKQDVAEVASRLFGSPVAPDHVIGEKLRRITPDISADVPSIWEQLSARVKDVNFEIPSSFAAFCQDPMASWLETTFGLEHENGTEYLKRANPKTVEQVGKRLSELTGLDEAICDSTIQRWLLHGYKCDPDPVSGNRPFAFRLHQFISKGDAVYATLGTTEDRWLTLQPQLFRPGHREERLYPLAFCRACGQEFYSVYLQGEAGKLEVVQRPASEDENKDDSIHPGYLMMLEEHWPTDPTAELERLPDEWKELFRGSLRLRRDRRDKCPIPHAFGKDGKETPGGLPVVFLTKPFCFCPNCRVTYSPRQRKDFGKLATLSSEGRSTATTVLSLSAIRHLKSASGMDEGARKLLSFTDNRQDASLQAGHFNDFAETGLLRAALHQAVERAGSTGLTHDKLSHAVFDVLNLPFADYAVDPTLKFAARDDTKQVLKDLLAYRLYRDLRRGWRINLPNLEQVGLLRLEYKSLTDLCAAEEEWVGKHTLLASSSSSDRAKWCRTLLDVLRRELAIKVDYLRSDYQDQLKQRSNQRLKEPWSVDEDEQLERATLAYPRQREEDDNKYRESLTFVGPRSAFGQFLKREVNRLLSGIAMPGTDLTVIIRQLFELLRIAGLLEVRDSSGEVHGYQIPADAIVWKVGDGAVLHDPLLQTTESNMGAIPNPFFVSFYKETAQHLRGLEAREHTAQVPAKQREEREEAFREGRLKILYCSPTMELGV